VKYIVFIGGNRSTT